MKFFNPFLVFFACLLALNSSFVYSANENVVKSSESVYRIWVAKLVPEDLIGQYPSAEQALNQYGYISKPPNVMFKSQGKEYLVLGHGSAFAINSDVLITNHHVIELSLNNVSENHLFLVRDDHHKLKAFPLEVLGFDSSSSGKDLAALKVKNLELVPLVFSSETSISENSSTFSIGFPGDGDILGGPEDPGFFVPKIHNGTLVSEHTHPNGHKVWQHDAAVSGGNSGGPIVNQCGEVVGVNTFVHVENQNVLFASANSALFDFLKGLNIDYQVASFKCRVSSMPQWLFFLLIGLGILILVLLIFVWNLKRLITQNKHKKTNSKLLNSVIQKLGGKEIKPLEENWQIDDDGKKYRYHPVHGFQYEDDIATSSPAPEKSDDIRSHLEIDILGSLDVIDSGKKILNHRISSNSEYLIGRDKAADIKIDNPFISSIHAKLSSVDGQLFLTDLNSTNGTMVDGKNLKPNQATSFTDASTVLLAKQNILLTFLRINDSDNEEVKTVQLEPSNRLLPIISIRVGECISVGRDVGNDIVIPNEFVHVSKQHLIFELLEGGVLRIEDKSSNGIYIDSPENKCQNSVLKVGQRVFLADESVSYKRMN